MPVSLACGSAGSRSKSGLLVVLVDYRCDFGFWHLRHERRDFVERVTGLMPFDNHVFEYFLHLLFLGSMVLMIRCEVSQVASTS